MLLPGPEAQQLAIYTGCLLNGVRGGLIAGTIFVLPGLLVMISLSALYVTFGDTSLVNGLFLGLAPVVVAIIGQALIGLGRRSLTQPSLILLAVAAFGGRRIGPLERPHRGARAAARHGQHPGRSRRVLSGAALVSFGGAYAAITYVTQQAVSAWG
jgi:chromate transporter